MSNFLDIFGIYDFVTRDSLILLLVALSAYVLLNAGLFAVPQVGFMAIGAYAAGALSTEYRAPLLLTLTSAGLLAAFAGGVLALLLSRLNGTYLAIATIGFGEIVRVVARNLDFTGGALGLRDVQRSLNDVVIVGAVIVAMVLLGRFNATRFGRAVEAIREDPLMTAHQGVSVARYRLGLFVLSGLLAGLAGGMHAHLGGFVQPGYFDFSLLTAILAAVVLGGMTSVYGPLLGGLVIFAAPQVFREVANYRNLLNGTLIILVIAVAPLGLAELIRRPFGWLVRERNSSADQRLSKAWTGEVSPGKIVQLGSSLDGAVPAPRKALAVESISKKFGGVTALRDVSLDVSYGEILGLIGPNGSGKTTLLNLLSGVYRPDSGTIRISGESVQKRFGRPEQLARADVARTFQSIRLVSEWTVRENVLIGMYLRQHAGLPASIVGLRAARREAVQCREETNETLHRLGLSDVADTMAGSLPYGLQRRVEIARALVRHPALLLLDEPTAGMTPAERDDIFSLVREVSVPEIAIIVVEHDVASITNTCGKIAVLNFGQLIAYGSAADVIQEEVVVDAYIGRRS